MKKPVTLAVTQPVTPGVERYRAREIDIQALLEWAYGPDQRVDLAYRRPERPAGYERAGRATAAIGRAGESGSIVFGGAYSTVRCHPDAEAVHEAVTRFDPQTTGLLIRMAKSCRSPDCFIGARLIEQPVLKAGGKPKILRDRSGNALGPATRTVWAVPQGSGWRTVSDSWETISHARAIYMMWRDALIVLRGRLTDCLTMHIATGPAALAQPWKKPVDIDTKKP